MRRASKRLGASQMLIDVHDDEVIALGWPWHGLACTQAGASWIELEGGERVDVDRFEHANDTWIFDAGRSDVSDPAVEAAGGSWWGRAIIRGGLFFSGCWVNPLTWPLSIQRADAVVPLCWPSEPNTPPQMIYHDTLGESSTRIAWKAEGGVQQVYLSRWTATQLGQGTDQPLCAAKYTTSSGGNGWRLVGQTEGEYSVRFKFLGAHQNRLLFGLRLATNQTSGQALADPPGTSSGSSISGAPQALCGLVELELDRALFGAESDPSEHIALHVLEDRGAALGQPTYSLVDQEASDGHSRLRIETTGETGALLTAWYAPDGTVRTARFSRYQRAEYDYLYTTSRRWKTSRRTEFTLLYGGSVVDERVLGEELEIVGAEGTTSITRRIYTTGEPDDVATWTDAYAAGSSLAPSPPAVFRAGANLVMGAVTYIVTIPGQGNVLREQDIRMIWLVAHSNNVASICASREPYDYPAGSNSYIVDVYSGRAIGPAGPVGGVMSASISKARAALYPYLRSFFAIGAWIQGTGQPLTGAVVRAKDYVDRPGAQMSWV